MNFNYTDLGNRKAGEVVEVTITGTGPNVLLLDSSNFSAFKSGRQYRYYGGLAARSPVRIPIPRGGRWYLVIHFGGFQGQCNYSAQVLPGALPVIPSTAQPSLTTIGDNLAAMHETDGIPSGQREWDVFISHATEDKDDSILPLWHKVTKAEVISYSPSLADKVARTTFDSTVEEIAGEITEIVGGVSEA